MPRVQKIRAEPMTQESFQPFGEIMDAKAQPTDSRQFFQVGFEADGRTKVSVIWDPFQGLKFTELERHFNVTQGFVPLAGSPAVVAVAPPTATSDREAVPAPEQVRAFLIDGTKGFAFKKGIWHSRGRFILFPPGASFVELNVDPNPTQIVDYKETFGVTFEVVL